MPYGVYIHIPFCQKVCHYCDFVKSANFSPTLVHRYFNSLVNQLKSSIVEHGIKNIKSVFVGGGTPSLFTHEYLPLFNVLASHLESDAEITLEANPLNITRDSLRIWRELGFNRISLGVQSFQETGLRALTRDHNAKTAREALELIATHFENFNCDLIYGWPGQTTLAWQEDLSIATFHGSSHLSLYTLTFEPRTVLGRKQIRGVINAAPDDQLLEMYELACSQLQSAGYEHLEVSNWSKPGYSCKHNWLYWSMDHYLGVGAGAHGFLNDGPIGLRYHYAPSILAFADDPRPVCEDRNSEDWMWEHLGSGLRTCKGVSLAQIELRTGKTFKPNAMILEATRKQLLHISRSELILSPKEWFREQAWALQVAKCFE